LTKKATLSFKNALKAFKNIHDLVKLRRSQDKADYTLLHAPFIYKLGDSIATFVELNTDESGNFKSLHSDSKEEEKSKENG
jgi:hypothetical protein